MIPKHRTMCSRLVMKELNEKGSVSEGLIRAIIDFGLEH